MLVPITHPSNAPRIFRTGIHDYNWHRPHASLGYNPPSSRLPLPLNNLLSLHI